MLVPKNTPVKSGYRMPAEWHQHDATLMHWPSNRETWPGDRLTRAETVFLNIIDTLSSYEPVLLLCDPSAIRRAEERIKSRVLDPGQVHLIEKPINDVWARDCGPICIKREKDHSCEYAMTDWDYNAWGNKYPPYDDDNKVPVFLADKFNIPVFQPGLVLEGGSIDTNGKGLLLTTESVLLNPNRNPGLDKPMIEQYLSHYLGVEKILWMKAGLAGDDTDGHIDDLCRFLNEDTVLTTVTGDPDDINYHTLSENRKRLENVSDQKGNRLNIVELPLPGTRINGTTADGSEFVPASYANFYIANGVVLVPLYDKRYDKQAMELLGHYFPDREVAGIECTDLVWGQGSIHCVTHQLYGIIP